MGYYPAHQYGEILIICFLLYLSALPWLLWRSPSTGMRTFILGNKRGKALKNIELSMLDIMDTGGVLSL